jgi:hypothetical protein
MLYAVATRPHKIYGLALILAPLFQTLSGFFWINGEYGATGGTLIFIATVFWIPALIALFGLVKDRMPNYAAWGLLIAVTGFISGSNFAMVGVFSEIFSIPHQSYLDGFEKYPLSTNILLFWPGPLAPLSLVILGIVLLRTKTVDSWIAILITAGGIAFPASRIARIEWTAHIADMLLFIPLATLGIQIIGGKKI